MMWLLVLLWAKLGIGVGDSDGQLLGTLNQSFPENKLSILRESCWNQLFYPDFRLKGYDLNPGESFPKKHFLPKLNFQTKKTYDYVLDHVLYC